VLLFILSQKDVECNKKDIFYYNILLDKSILKGYNEKNIIKGVAK
jgi:hypothetical protein